MVYNISVNAILMMIAWIWWWKEANEDTF